MYSWLCLSLLTWSDLGEDFNEDGDRYNNAGANYEHSKSVVCAVVGMT
jgi:hypothetical protein